MKDAEVNENHKNELKENQKIRSIQKEWGDNAAEDVRFRTLFNRVFDAIFVIDGEENFVDANEAACRLFGYPKEELLNLSKESLHPKEDFCELNKAIKEVFKKGIGQINEISFISKNGHIIYADGSGILIEIDGKKYIVGSFRDITEKKKAKEALRQTEQKYNTLINNLNVGVFRSTVQGKGNFWEINPALVKMFGYESREEMFSLDVSDLYSSPGRRKNFVDKIMRQGYVKNMESMFKRKDGTVFIGSVSAVAVKDRNGSAQFYDGIIEDTTGQREAEKALHRAFSEISDLKEQLQAECTYLREEIKLEHNFENIIGQSNILRETLFKVEQVAPTNTTVLISGETGVGKELIARAIHDSSRRRDRLLMKVNCAALTPSLIESELFGHERGAFTGAQNMQKGRFEIADGSTLFLDEIGELPLELQAKLLRALEEGEFERIGSTKTLKVDVRVIAATNRNLEEEVRNGKFREDFYYRLSVFPIIVPPLRERKKDIPLLVTEFVNRLNKKLGKRVERVSDNDMKAMLTYTWPGNVRELKNVIERAVINSKGSQLRLADKLEIKKTRDLDINCMKTMRDLEREHILSVLGHTYWRVEGKFGAASILDINPSTLRARMRKLGIRKRNVEI